MIEVRAAGPGSAAERSLAACLASLLEVDLEAIPRGGRAPALVVARQWLAERGLGLVRVAEPQEFSWAGPWIAELRDGDGDGEGDGDGAGEGNGDGAGEGNGDGAVRYAIMFGIPSGVIFDPLGLPPDAPGQLQAGYVLASLEPPRPARSSAPLNTGRVEAIFVAPHAEAPMRRLEQVRARAGKGLEGDRYAAGQGTFSVDGGNGNEITLIAAEVLDLLELPDGRPLSGAEARRNLITRGLDLNLLVGRRFQVGELELIGRRRCEPCAHLQRLTRPGALRALVHRGGLRADLLTSGTLHVGDPIVAATGDR